MCVRAEGPREQGRPGRRMSRTCRWPGHVCTFARPRPCHELSRVASLSQRPATHRTPNTRCPALYRNIRQPFLRAKDPSGTEWPPDHSRQVSGGSVAAVSSETAGPGVKNGPMGAWGARSHLRPPSGRPIPPTERPSLLPGRRQRRRAPEPRDPSRRAGVRRGSPLTSWKPCSFCDPVFPPNICLQAQNKTSENCSGSQKP